MKELTFRGKDRYRQLSRMPLVVLAFGLIVGGSSVVFRLGNPAVTCWMMGAGAAVVSFGIFIVLRSWTRVGAAGITIFHRDFARIVRWWELSTDPAARFVPPDTSLSRRAPTVLGVILVLLIALGVLLVTNQA